MEKTVKIEGKEIPCKDVIQIQTIFTDAMYCEITYMDSGQKVTVVVNRNKGYEIEKKVRKAMNKR